MRKFGWRPPFALLLAGISAGCSLVSLSDLDERASTGDPDGGADGAIGQGKLDGSQQVTERSGPSTTLDAESGAADAGLDASTPRFNTIFVSSQPYSANLGGLAGADAKCTALANAAGRMGGYVAILSTSGVNAKDRFNATGPILRVDRAVVANDSADLWSGSIRQKINLDENGVSDNGVLVLSGTDPDGIADRGATQYCLGWTSAATSQLDEIGRTDRVNEGWISVYGQSGTTGNSCDTAGTRIYCIGPK